MLVGIDDEPPREEPEVLARFGRFLKVVEHAREVGDARRRELRDKREVRLVLGFELTQRRDRALGLGGLEFLAQGGLQRRLHLRFDFRGGVRVGEVLDGLDVAEGDGLAELGARQEQLTHFRALAAARQVGAIALDAILHDGVRVNRALAAVVAELEGAEPE
jgi:hypothetical protein